MMNLVDEKVLYVISAFINPLNKTPSDIVKERTEGIKQLSEFGAQVYDTSYLDNMSDAQGLICAIKQLTMSDILVLGSKWENDCLCNTLINAAELLDIPIYDYEDIITECTE